MDRGKKQTWAGVSLVHAIEITGIKLSVCLKACSAEKEDLWLQSIFFFWLLQYGFKFQSPQKHSFIKNIIFIINYLTRYTPEFHVSLFNLTNVSCPYDKIYCHLSCGNLKHLQKYAVDSFNKLFRLNSKLENPGRVFLTQVIPYAGVLAWPKVQHRVRNKCAGRETCNNGCLA